MASQVTEPAEANEPATTIEFGVAAETEIERTSTVPPEVAISRALC